MKQIIFRFTSFLVVSALALAWAPNYFHHEHENINQCDHSNDLNEINPCHVSLFHSEEAEAVACEHNAHITKDEDECQWCSLLSPKRHKYKLPKFASFGLDHWVEFLEETHFEHTVQTAISLKPSRAPPAMA